MGSTSGTSSRVALRPDVDVERRWDELCIGGELERQRCDPPIGRTAVVNPSEFVGSEAPRYGQPFTGGGTAIAHRRVYSTRRIVRERCSRPVPWTPNLNRELAQSSRVLREQPRARPEKNRKRPRF